MRARVNDSSIPSTSDLFSWPGQTRECDPGLHTRRSNAPLIIPSCALEVADAQHLVLREILTRMMKAWLVGLSRLHLHSQEARRNHPGPSRRKHQISVAALYISHFLLAMRITALLVSIGLAALSLGASAQAYNWSITDQSPLITYHPLSVGDNSTSWNSSFSGSSWANNADPVSYSSAVGHGRSAHTTDVDGATASVGFVGTAVYVWGQTSQLSALLLVDGVSRSFSGGQDGIIGSAEGLDNKWHDVKLSVRGLDYVQVYGFTFTSDIGR